MRGGFDTIARTMKLIPAACFAALLATAGICGQQAAGGYDVAVLSGADAPAGTIWLDTLDLTKWSIVTE